MALPPRPRRLRAVRRPLRRGRRRVARRRLAGGRVDFHSFAALVIALARTLAANYLPHPMLSPSELEEEAHNTEAVSLNIVLSEDGALMIEGMALLPPEPGVLERLGMRTGRAIRAVGEEVRHYQGELEGYLERSVHEPLREFQFAVDPLGPVDWVTRSYIPSWHRPLLGQARPSWRHAPPLPSSWLRAGCHVACIVPGCMRVGCVLAAWLLLATVFTVGHGSRPGRPTFTAHTLPPRYGSRPRTLLPFLAGDSRS